MSILIVCDRSTELATLIAMTGAAVPDDPVRGFSHPASALDWCENHTPDLVLVDMLMRATNGIELIRRLRALPHMAGVPLVLLLPRGFEQVAASALRHGASDFLATPAVQAELAARVGNLLALRVAQLASGAPGLAAGSGFAGRALVH
ncbi:MAG: response regulator [Burkholderiales bacterium]|nr:response regulator [Burkholderiales bacterium]